SFAKVSTETTCQELKHLCAILPVFVQQYIHERACELNVVQGGVRHAKSEVAQPPVQPFNVPFHVVESEKQIRFHAVDDSVVLHFRVEAMEVWSGEIESRLRHGHRLRLTQRLRPGFRPGFDRTMEVLWKPDKPCFFVTIPVPAQWDHRQVGLMLPAFGSRPVPTHRKLIRVKYYVGQLDHPRTLHQTLFSPA